MSAKKPMIIMTLRKINPIKRENRPMITTPAMSSKSKDLFLSSVMRFQGENRDRNNCGIEKKFTINQKKFVQT